MHFNKEENFSSSDHTVIINPHIHKKAKLSREEFLKRVSDVEEIRTRIDNISFTFYIQSLTTNSNLKKLHDIVTRYEFNINREYTFAVAIKPKLFNWLKTTEYPLIQKQIVFWLTSLYFFTPKKRHILEQQLYKPLFEEILKLIDCYYAEFKLPNFGLLNERLLRDNDEKIFEEEDRCTKEYLRQCTNYYQSAPPEFLISPFDYERDKDWVNESYGFEVIEAYFKESDWEFVIVKEKKDSLRRTESNQHIWDKWKHTYSTFDQTQNAVYSFFHASTEVSKDRKPKVKRDKISQEVRDLVWRRDEGKCCKCGSREKLEFDHIIPVAKNGSSTSRNIELLCEKCNRKKHSSLGGI